MYSVFDLRKEIRSVFESTFLGKNLVKKVEPFFMKPGIVFPETQCLRESAVNKALLRILDGTFLLDRTFCPNPQVRNSESLPETKRFFLQFFLKMDIFLLRKHGAKKIQGHEHRCRGMWSWAFNHGRQGQEDGVSACMLARPRVQASTRGAKCLQYTHEYT
jgi:hypothetical protein